MKNQFVGLNRLMAWWIVLCTLAVNTFILASALRNSLSSLVNDSSSSSDSSSLSLSVSSSSSSSSSSPLSSSLVPSSSSSSSSSSSTSTEASYKSSHIFSYHIMPWFRVTRSSIRKKVIHVDNPSFQKVPWEACCFMYHVTHKITITTLKRLLAIKENYSNIESNIPVLF